MSDWQNDQGPEPIPEEGASAGRISLRLAICLWVLVLAIVFAMYARYWTGSVTLYLVLALLLPLIKLSPLVAAVGVYFGFKGLEAQNIRVARLGILLNAAAFVVGVIALVR
jgi:hypothetical protein